MNPFGARSLSSLLLGLCLLELVPSGCASSPSSPRSRRFPSAIFRGARHVGHHRAPGDETSAMVIERIHAAGFRFGTDGTPGALWGYMRTSHELIDPRDAHAGDVVFFDTRSHDEEELDCADRVGLVESVEADGRITFLEARGGQLYRGFVDPRQPLTRRDDRGEILNSFLRPKHLSDPEGTRYFAGEMLCGIARVRPLW